MSVRRINRLLKEGTGQAAAGLPRSRIHFHAHPPDAGNIDRSLR